MGVQCNNNISTARFLCLNANVLCVWLLVVSALEYCVSSQFPLTKVLLFSVIGNQTRDLLNRVPRQQPLCLEEAHVTACNIASAQAPRHQPSLRLISLSYMRWVAGLQSEGFATKTLVPFFVCDQLRNINVRLAWRTRPDTRASTSCLADQWTLLQASCVGVTIDYTGKA